MCGNDLLSMTREKDLSPKDRETDGLIDRRTDRQRVKDTDLIAYRRINGPKERDGKQYENRVREI